MDQVEMHEYVHQALLLNIRIKTEGILVGTGRDYAVYLYNGILCEYVSPGLDYYGQPLPLTLRNIKIPTKHLNSNPHEPSN